MTVVTVMTVVLGCPLNLYGTVNGAAFPRSRRRRGAGRKPCIKGVQRESLAHAPCLQGVVCYTLQKRAVKTGAVFQQQGWLYEPREARKTHACTERLRGVLPQGGRAQNGKALSSPPRLPPVGQDCRISLCCGFSARDRGYPDIAVTTVITVTRLLCERNQPALFLPAVRIADMVVR